jgi:SMC interacting uncharacterized protein involved in chromosome segregation
MKLDMNNIVIYLLIIFACGLSSVYMNSLTKSIDNMVASDKEQAEAITTLISEVKHLKENNGEIEMLKGSLKANWEKYAELKKQYNDEKQVLLERILRLELKVEDLEEE